MRTRIYECLILSLSHLFGGGTILPLSLQCREGRNFGDHLIQFSNFIDRYWGSEKLNHLCRPESQTVAGVCLELSLLRPILKQPSSKHPAGHTHSAAQCCVPSFGFLLPRRMNWASGRKKSQLSPGQHLTGSSRKGHKYFQNSSDHSEWLASFNYFRLIYLTFPRNWEMFKLGYFIAYFMFKHWIQKQVFALLILNKPKEGT